MAHKTKSRTLVALGAVALAFAGAKHGEAAPPPSVNVRTNLVFGTVLACNLAGTVTIGPSGNRSVTGCLVGAGTLQHAAQLRTKGPGVPFILSVATVPVVLTGGAGHTMTADRFRLKIHGGVTTGTNQITFTPGGHTLVDMGGDLHVKANQAAGSYSGTFTVIFSQQ